MHKHCSRCKLKKDRSCFSKLGSYCRACSREMHKNYLRLNPWSKTFNGIKNRCNKKNHPSYDRYGAKGIKCLITLPELKRLWIRDKASLLKRPSIDRIDPDKHYTFDNCQFIELTENVLKRRFPVCKNEVRVLKYLKNKDWSPASEIARAVWGKHSSSAFRVCLNLLSKGKLIRNKSRKFKLFEGV